MTPKQLFDEVLLTIPHLVYDKQDALEALLKKSLRVYQELAGVTLTMQVDHDQVDHITKPPFFLKLVTAYDENRRWVQATEDDNSLQIIPSESSKGPYSIVYLLALSELDISIDRLPSSVAVSVLSDYLHELIEERNNEALRRVYVSGGMDVSGLRLPSEIKEAQEQAKAAMKSRRAILPMVTVA